MRAILAALLAALAPAAAADTWLTASGLSYHFERNGYCEVNPGAGFEHDVAPRLRLLAGDVKNSRCLPSNYVGGFLIALEIPTRAGVVRAGGALIAVSGYRTDEKGRDRILYAPLPGLALEGRRIGVNLVLLPPHEDFKGGIALQLKVRLP